MNDEQRAALVEQAEEDIVHCIAFHQRLAYADAYDIDPDSDQMKGHEGIGEGTSECAHGVMETVNRLIERLLAERHGETTVPDAERAERAAEAIHDVDTKRFPDVVRHIPARTVYQERARAALLLALGVTESEAETP